MEVQGAKMTLHTGEIGIGKYEKQATYVLVDAKNTSSSDMNVSLGGAFLDKKGTKIGTLKPDSLRIPAGQVRTFALVGDTRSTLPEAAQATIEVTSAVRLNYGEQFVISDLHQYPDGNRIVVAAYVQNKVARIGKVLVFATFYDDKGRPMKRPSSVFHLERKARRGVQFVGPQGSVRATMSIGAIVY